MFEVGDIVTRTDGVRKGIECEVVTIVDSHRVRIKAPWQPSASGSLLYENFNLELVRSAYLEYDPNQQMDLETDV